MKVQTASQVTFAVYILIHLQTVAICTTAPTVITSKAYSKNAVENTTKDFPSLKILKPVPLVKSATNISTQIGSLSDKVNGCPRYCKCEIVTIQGGVENNLTIRECSKDPTTDLSYLMALHAGVRVVEILNASLSSIPCKALLLLKYAFHLVISGNTINTAYCGEINDWLNIVILTHNNIEKIPYPSGFLNHLSQLDLSHNRLREVPCSVGLSKSLRKLSLGWNRINAIRCDLSKLSMLDRLMLDHNRLETLPCNITVLSGLKYLDLSSNKIKGVLCDMLRLGKLKKLYLSHNHLQTFPCNITTLSQLTKLDISYNFIKSIPCDLSRLSALRELDMSGNHLSMIAHQVGSLHALKRLDISNNNLEVIPCDLFKLSKLNVLILCNNSIQVLECNMAEMLALSDVDLSHNEISTVPRSFLSLQHRLSLDLSYNYLETAGSLTALGKLYRLNLSHNKILGQSWNLSQTSGLTFLDLSHNLIDSMPCRLTALPFLETLDLSHNHIITVPCNFTSLQQELYLNLGYNSIEHCPHIVSGLFVLDLSHNLIDAALCILTNASSQDQPKFRQLMLDYNRMKTFPCGTAQSYVFMLELNHNEVDTVTCELSQMTLLKYLYLDYNNLSSIPCNLTTVPTLDYLYLRHNHINVVPDCMGNFRSLGAIILDFNQISVIPDKVFHHIQNLRIISLMNNKLLSIGGDAFTHFQQLQSLHIVNLGQNQLQKLDSWPVTFARKTNFLLNTTNNSISEFTNVGELPTTSCLNLHMAQFEMIGNNIRHITDVFNGWNVEALSSEEICQCMSVFDFSNNPLMCDCTDYHIYAAIYNTKQQNIMSQNLQCRYPAELRGQNPTFVPLDLFVCNVSNACPDGCLCYDTPHSRNISVICTGCKDTELPVKMPALPKHDYSYYLDWHHTNLETIGDRAYFKNTNEAVFSQNVISSISLNALISLVNASKLYLDNNHLQRLPATFTSAKLPHGLRLKLGNNYWLCDCNVTAMTTWLIKNRQNIQDIENVTCFSPPYTRGRQIMYLDMSAVCGQEMFDVAFVIAILSGIIFLLFISLPLVCVMKLKLGVRAHKRQDWEPMDWDEEADDGKEFDVFVSYSNEDEEYVGEYLIPELENRGFKVCFHRVHFLAGKSIIDNICECIAKSKKVLAFYSMNYSDSEFGMYEYTLALQLDVQNATNRLITIVDTGLDVENLQIAHCTYLRTHSYVIKEEANFWQNLLYTLPKQKLGDVAQENDED